MGPIWRKGVAGKRVVHRRSGDGDFWEEEEEAQEEEDPESAEPWLVKGSRVLAIGNRRVLPPKQRAFAPGGPRGP